MILFDERAASDSHSELDVTPMINVVFLLLVFFMLAGTLAPADPLGIDPARTERRETAPVDGLRIGVDRYGALSLNDQRVDAAEFDRRIVRYSQVATGQGEARSDGTGGAAPAPVSITADAALPAEQLLAIMQRLREIGLTEVNLLSVGDTGY